MLQTTVLYEALDEFQPHVEANPANTVVSVGIVTGLVASVGYLLLTARAGYWVLTLLLAKPLMWKRLDPMEVLFAWEQEKKRRRAQGARESQQLEVPEHGSPLVSVPVSVHT